ncbi:MAG: hypothetical protein R2844_20380 [Caldilineales bacterium]
MIAYGNNGIVIPGFLEFINFDQIGDGYQISPMTAITGTPLALLTPTTS